MTTHDADKTNSAPEDRRTMTRDPNATGGPIVESGETRKGNPVTIAGSTHLTTNIDGKWYVCNSRGEKLLQKAFDTETEAVEEAQKRNNPDAVDSQHKEKHDAEDAPAKKPGSEPKQPE